MGSFAFLQKNRFRSLLSILGVFFGVASLVTMLSIGEGAKREMLQEITRLGTKTIVLRARGNPFDGYLYREVEGALGRRAEIAGVLELKEKKHPVVYGVTKEYFSLFEMPVAKGRSLTPLDYEKGLQSIVLGGGLAKQWGAKASVGSSLELGGELFTVVGILAEERQSAFMPYSLAAGLYKEPGEHYQEIFLKVHREKEIALVASMARRMLRGREAEVVVAEELLQQKQRAQLTFNVVLASVAGAALLVGGIGIVNALLASLFERVKEIGIRRALGATKAHIAQQLLFEALVLGAIGAFSGVLLGTFASYLIGKGAGIAVAYPFWIYALGVGAALTTAALAGIYPARCAAKVNPVDALRSN